MTIIKKDTQKKSAKKDICEEKTSNFLMTFLKKVPWIVREDAIPLHAAALTFFAVFSLLPLLLLTYISFDALSQGVATEFLYTTQETLGTNATNTLIAISKDLQTFQDHWSIYAIGLIIVLYAATRFVFFLQKSMNFIWKVPTPRKWFKQEIKHRIISVASIFILAFISIIIILQKAALIVIQKQIGPELTMLINYISVTIAIYSIMAIIYKVVPDRKIEWSDVSFGAAFSTVLFWGGLFLIQVFIRESLVNTVYGTISGILLILLWVYYFAQIIYIGAEITKVYATHYGSLQHLKKELIPEKKDLVDINE